MSKVLWPSIRTKSGIYSTADNLGAQLSSRLCACRGHPLLPWKQAKKGHFSGRPAEAVARRVDRVPPARRTVPPAAAAAEERGDSRLAQDTLFWWNELPKLHLRHI